MEMDTAAAAPHWSNDAPDRNGAPRRCGTASEVFVKISIGSVGMVTVLVVGAIRPAVAQDLVIGYQFQRLLATGDTLNLPGGFNIDISAPVLGDVRVLGQFDFSRRTESKVI